MHAPLVTLRSPSVYHCKLSVMSTIQSCSGAWVWLIITILVIDCCAGLSLYFLSCVRMHSRVKHLVPSVCIIMCILKINYLSCRCMGLDCMQTCERDLFTPLLSDVATNTCILPSSVLLADMCCYEQTSFLSSFISTCHLSYTPLTVLIKCVQGSVKLNSFFFPTSAYMYAYS